MWHMPQQKNWNILKLSRIMAHIQLLVDQSLQTIHGSSWHTFSCASALFFKAIPTRQPSKTGLPRMHEGPFWPGIPLANDQKSGVTLGNDTSKWEIMIFCCHLKLPKGYLVLTHTHTHVLPPRTPACSSPCLETLRPEWLRLWGVTNQGP